MQIPVFIIIYACSIAISIYEIKRRIKKYGKNYFKIIGFDVIPFFYACCFIPIINTAFALEAAKKFCRRYIGFCKR
jgi:hypothetical protein